MKKPITKMTERELCLYRAKLSCKVGRDNFGSDGKRPAGISQGDYGIYCLLQAVEDIAAAMEGKDEK